MHTNVTIHSTSAPEICANVRNRERVDRANLVPRVFVPLDQRVGLRETLGALSFCSEKPVVPVINQMERTFPLEIFGKKRNTF